MSATDKLRRLLDERGVEWDADDEVMDDGTLSQVTYWYCNGIGWSTDGRDEYLAFDAVQLLTPEQAIAATLGAGTCHDNGGTDENDQQVFECDACGCLLSLYDRDGVNNLCTSFICDYPRFCPACGRKVVDE